MCSGIAFVGRCDILGQKLKCGGRLPSFLMVWDVFLAPLQSLHGQSDHSSGISHCRHTSSMMSDNSFRCAALSRTRTSQWCRTTLAGFRHCSTWQASRTHTCGRAKVFRHLFTRKASLFLMIPSSLARYWKSYC